MNIFPLDKFSHIFPDPNDASPEGIVAYGGDLNPNRIIKGYMNGIFPWYNDGDPILWWSPNPRLILKLEDFKCSKSLQKIIDKQIYEVRFNTNFKQTIQECSNINREGQKGTWILPEVIEAYCALYEMGFAHSFETYLNDELVGGGYGIALGDIFCGESMFSKQNNASKVALYHLVKRLKHRDFSIIDCQIPTEHLKSLGAKEISREAFLQLVEQSLVQPREF